MRRVFDPEDVFRSKHKSQPIGGLFAPLEPPAQLPSNGSKTSKAAAEAMGPRAGTNRARVLQQIRLGAATRSELAVRCGLSKDTINSAVNFLVNAGWAYTSGEKDGEGVVRAGQAQESAA